MLKIAICEKEWIRMEVIIGQITAPGSLHSEISRNDKNMNEHISESQLNSQVVPLKI